MCFNNFTLVLTSSIVCGRILENLEDFMSNNLAKTHAFNTFVDDKFVSKFVDYLEPHFDVNNEDAESELIEGMCRYYAEYIYEKFSFREIKANYNKKMSQLNPNLDYIQAKKLIDREQTKLETFARLKYCFEDIKIGYYDIECLSHLFLIYAKLNKKSVKDITSNKVYQYLYWAYLKRENIDLNLSIHQHAKALQNAMVSVDYNADDFSYYSFLHDDGTLDLPDRYETKLTEDEIEKYNEINGTERAQFVAEKLFKERLIAEMHTLDNGMVF